MKKHTAESLHRMALRTGASVEIDGVTHNAGRAVVPLRAVPPTPAAPVVSTEPPKPAPIDPQVLALMAEVLRLQNLNASVMGAIKTALAEMKPGTRPRKWSFKFTRDADKLLLGIEAEAKE